MIQEWLAVVCICAAQKNEGPVVPLATEPIPHAAGRALATKWAATRHEC